MQYKERRTSNYKYVGQNPYCCSPLHCSKCICYSLRHFKCLTHEWTLIFLTKQFFRYHMYTFNTKEDLITNWMSNPLVPFNRSKCLPVWLLVSFHISNLTIIWQGSKIFKLSFWFYSKFYNLFHTRTWYDIITVNLHALFTKTNFTIPACYPCREFLNIFIKISKCLVKQV